MKYIMTTSLLVCSILMFACSGSKKASSEIKEASFFVDGICGMCEDRIENAAYIKGVKQAEWDKESKTLKITYIEGKTNPTTVMQSVAKAGHDTEKIKATDEDYDKKVHSCCKYREMESH